MLGHKNARPGVCGAGCFGIECAQVGRRVLVRRSELEKLMKRRNLNTGRVEM